MTAIIFDVDDTLYDQTVPFRRAYEALFGNSLRLPMEELFAASRRRSDEVFGPSQRGEITMEEMYIYRIQKAFGDVGASITDREALDFQEEYAKNQRLLQVSGRMEQILDYCAARTQIGILTNGPSEHQWKKVRALGAEKWFPRGHIFVSGDLGEAKPKPEAFRLVESRMEAKPGELYMVGDSYENDVAGAKGAGWKAVWLNRRGRRLPEQGPRPDYCAGTEEELQLILQKILEEQG